MKTSIEQFPIELWISIFSYLETHYLFQAFGSLNNCFNRLLASKHISFYTELRKNDYNDIQYPDSVCLSDSVLNRTIILQLLDESRCISFCRFFHENGNKLIHLQSLTINLPNQNLFIMYNVLQELKSLRYFSMKFSPNQHLLETILAASSLRICKLDLYPTYSTFDCDPDRISNIETLFIKFQGGSVQSIINLLPSHMPKLERLELVAEKCSSHDLHILYKQQLFIMKHLRILKLTMNYDDIRLNQFQYLSHNMPNLKCFELIALDFSLEGTLINNLNKYWWPNLKYIKKIKIIIRFNWFYDENPWNRRKHFAVDCRENLLMIKNQTNTCLNIKQIGTNIKAHYWEIMITKF